ncbi:MAG: TRAP transporter large permease subunit [Euryarchaeota archaeon]|nr:TRAP transporter large permease subunit [Euryarchaeota archaeon]
MQSTESGRENTVVEETPRGLSGQIRQWLHLPVVLLWIGVGLYSRFQSVRVVPYTVGLVGTAVCLRLAIALVDDGEPPDSRLDPAGPPPSGRSAIDRLLLTGCLLGMAIGTGGMVSAAGEITASQPGFATSALVAAVLVIGALFALVGRWFGPVAAGLAVGGIGIGWLTTPTSVSVIETMAYDNHGLYGPLTRAAASWIAPACLLAGLWRASRTADRLGTLAPTVRGSGWFTGRRLARGLRLLTPPSMGFVALLVAWVSVEASYLQVIGAAAIPAVLCWVALLVGSHLAASPIRIEGPTRPVDWRAWSGPLFLIGGPLAVMAVLLVGLQLPVGVVLVAGGLCLIGLCLVGPWLGIAETAETPDKSGQERLRGGVGTVLDGAAIGVGLFARVAVLLAAVGGVTALLRVDVSTGLLSAVLGLSGGNTLLVVVVGGIACVVLGTTLPVLAGYATAAVLVVPLLRTLTPIAELTAHLFVWYAVVGGWLLAPATERRLRALVAAIDSS